MEDLHKIAVVGIGGCGNNAVRFVKGALNDTVAYFVFDTGVRTLSMHDGVTRTQIGEQTTNGRSAGAIPDVGTQSALESLDTMLEQLIDFSLIFFVGGLGGGTATGALPVLAKHLQDQEVVTIFVATTPFEFEGKKKGRFAQTALNEIVQYGDSTLVISNQKMLQTLPKNCTLQHAFNCANNILKESVLGICSLIMNTGNINLDYADLQTILKQSGYAIIGKGVASGKDRIQNAMKEALHTPLLEDYDLSTAKRLLVNMTASENMRLDEMHEAGLLIHEHVSEDIPIIWGTEIIESESDEVSVYVILTGVKPVQGLAINNLHIVNTEVQY